jgi:hypothetical protein
MDHGEAILRRLKPGMTVPAKASSNLTDRSTEAEKYPLLRVVAGQRLAKTWKTFCVLQYSDL